MRVARPGLDSQRKAHYASYAPVEMLLAWASLRRSCGSSWFERFEKHSRSRGRSRVGGGPGAWMPDLDVILRYASEMLQPERQFNLEGHR